MFLFLVDEIMAKWKHLRDHFHREIKLQEAGEAHKKRKYVYFDDMEFMRPFVGFKLPSLNRSSVKTFDSMDESQDFKDNDTDIDMDLFLKSSDYMDEEEETKANVSNSSSQAEGRNRSKRVIKLTPKALQNKPTSSGSTPATGLKRSQRGEAIIKNFDVLKKTSGGSNAGSSSTNPTFKIRDGDISFCLSLVPTLRKLGDGHKLRAKIEILKILHKYVDHLERRKIATRSTTANHNNTNNNNQTGGNHDYDMAEDHLEEYEEGGGVSVKHEEHDDPLNNSGGGGGNTKAWWT